MPVAHHHRTLVINNSSGSESSNNNNTAAAAAASNTTAIAITTVGNSTAPAAAKPGSAAPIVQQGSSSGCRAATASSGWVAKRDRHFQLINSSIYDKEVQARTRAIARTREEKLLRKEAREKQKFNRYLQDAHGHSTHEIEVGGERFRVTAGGSKLVRLSGEQRAHFSPESDSRFDTHAGDSSVTNTPKKAVLGGVQFQRSRNGNLWRAGLIRASR